jgi:hypothetical protein
MFDYPTIIKKTPINKETKTPQQTETHKPDEIKNKHAVHFPNLWNLECYNLFKYLFENYYDANNKTNRKLTNIWHFFKESENQLII